MATRPGQHGRADRPSPRAGVISTATGTTALIALLAFCQAPPPVESLKSEQAALAKFAELLKAAAAERDSVSVVLAKYGWFEDSPDDWTAQHSITPETMAHMAHDLRAATPPFVSSAERARKYRDDAETRLREARIYDQTLAEAGLDDAQRLLGEDLPAVHSFGLPKRKYDTRRNESFQVMNRLLGEDLPAVTKKPRINPSFKTGPAKVDCDSSTDGLAQLRAMSKSTGQLPHTSNSRMDAAALAAGTKTGAVRPAPALASKTDKQADAKSTLVAKESLHTEYWRHLDRLRPHRASAQRYIKSLDTFILTQNHEIAAHPEREAKESHVKKKQIAERVRKYLWHFCRLCNDSPDNCRHPPNRKMLTLIEKTLCGRVGGFGGARQGTRAEGAKGGGDGSGCSSSAPAKRPQKALSGLMHAQCSSQQGSMTRRGSAAAASCSTATAVSRSWNMLHTRNKEEMYCYCGGNDPAGTLLAAQQRLAFAKLSREKFVGRFDVGLDLIPRIGQHVTSPKEEEGREPCVQCDDCNNWFHLCCITPGVVPACYLPFVVSYCFRCKHCNNPDTHSFPHGVESFQHKQPTWLESIRSALGHLYFTTQRDRFKVKEIADHLALHWETMVSHHGFREKGKPGDKQRWRDALNSYLTNNKKDFARPQKFYWSFAMGDEDDGMGPALQPCRLLPEQQEVDEANRKATGVHEAATRAWKSARRAAPSSSA